MLSSQAFNAFLKTLEEPPSYAIFILATTEKHKIIPTILSRCQIFDFKRIQVEDTVLQLQHICDKEEIKADPEAFDHADTFIIDRQRNRHTAFGLGIHRCVGSNLARMEMRVALEEWMDAFPDFELADPEAVTWSTGQVRGPRSMPIRLTPHA